MSEEKMDNLQNADGNENLQENNPIEEAKKEATPKVNEDTKAILNEIDQENAEDAEDTENTKRHEIPVEDYEAMSLDGLVGELKKLLHNEKIQAIKKHTDAIRYEFDKKYADLLEEKKEEFLADGGNEIDFKYNVPTRKVFYDLYNEYRDKRNQYYKELEDTLQANLARRQDIIEEIKGLINTEEDINTTFKMFKQLQEQWFKAGPVPRNHYNDLWQNYHHHVENFYDFLDLNRDLRDMDFKHNLEEKLKIVEKAESLAKENDVAKAFRELQILHKVWKEDIGPVARENREEIWHRFSEATKTIHEKRQSYLQNLDKIYEQNVAVKSEIIEKIKSVSNKDIQLHNGWQRAIKEVETLREAFFNAGKVPAHLSDEVWHKFKESVRSFNRKKNLFYKNLKKDQQENLEKKLALIEIAKANQDNEDWEATTPVMKKIQEDWKHIGHVPRKYSDKIWKDFKKACNHYFGRMHKVEKSGQSAEYEALDKKKNFLDSLKEYTLSGNKEKDMETLQQFTEQWSAIGRVPFSKRNIDAKFNKIIDAIYKKLDLDKQEIELLRYNNKLERLANDDNDNSLNHEMIFVRRKIDEVKSEVLQLENNLQFFSNVDESNPLVRDVIKNINNHKDNLKTWKAKLRELRSLQASQNQEDDENENTE